MTDYVYATATSLDGFIADEQDSLSWLFVQELDDDGPGDPRAFLPEVGALVMGATTYSWLGDHLARTGESWPYEVPCFVFTHRTPEPLADGVRFVSGPPAEHRTALEEAAGDRDVWVVGGGGLAADFAEAGMLDRVELSVAPVTLGAGRPVFPRRHDLRLTEHARNGAFLVATYDVVGDPSGW